MKLTNKTVNSLREKGWSFRKIAKHFGKSVSTIYDRNERHIRDEKLSTERGLKANEHKSMVKLKVGGNDYVGYKDENSK